MKTIGQYRVSGRGWMGLLASLVLGGVSFAQTGDVSSLASGSSTTLQTFQQEQGELAQEWLTLVAQGATQQQLDAWRQQNAGRFQAQQQLAQTLATASALQPMPVAARVDIPANASSTLTDFLTTLATLATARGQIHNQLLQAMPAGATQEQVNAMQQQEMQIFRQLHTGDLQLQQQRAQILDAESGSRPMPVPGPPVIPTNATPQLRAYLTARNALASDWTRVWNQNVTADPASRQAAIQQWQQQNAGRFEQLREKIQDLSNSTATQEGTNQ